MKTSCEKCGGEDICCPGIDKNKLQCFDCGNIMEDDDEKTLFELIEEYQEEHKLYRMEGPSGVDNLTQVLGALNSDYSTVEDFLMDNSGAIEAILEWVAEQDLPEWREAVESELTEKDNNMKNSVIDNMISRNKKRKK